MAPLATLFVGWSGPSTSSSLENGIEYWSGHDFQFRCKRAASKSVPQAGFEPTSVHHVACYVRGGSYEGNIIENSLVLRDGTLFNLDWVKTFGKEEENWMIARALESVARQHHLLAGSAGTRRHGQEASAQRHERRSNLTERVELVFDEQHVTVRTESGACSSTAVITVSLVAERSMPCRPHCRTENGPDQRRRFFAEINQASAANDQTDETRQAA